uniref:BPTI/Kunitz inhibitor domain-containing protein n=1 Tax=Neogobius melanostomus TaxID=47308 RepID=A0A8C6TNY8_9GOBI
LSAGHVCIYAVLLSSGGRCARPLDPGPCRDYLVRWYYDPIADSCAQFWFGGCGGNGNRFETERSCLQTCVRTRRHNSLQ